MAPLPQRTLHSLLKVVLKLSTVICGGWPYLDTQQHRMIWQHNISPFLSESPVSPFNFGWAEENQLASHMRLWTVHFAIAIWLFSFDACCQMSYFAETPAWVVVACTRVQYILFTYPRQLVHTKRRMKSRTVCRMQWQRFTYFREKQS